MGGKAKSGGSKTGGPLPWVWAIGSAIIVVFVALLVFDSAIRPFAGWALLGIFVLGIVLALAASVEQGNRAKVWGELGRSLLVAGLLAFAVWLVGELRRPVEERNALQVTLGLQQEMPGVDLHGKDLDGFSLAGRNLEGADLEGAQLGEASLVRTNLTDANLANADLSGANIKKADLGGADLSHADLQGVEATKVDLHEARLLGADLSGAELSGADMRGSCLADGSLVDASLPDAHLEGAALTGADLEGARFWFDLRRAYLEEIGLDGAEHTLKARWPPGFADRAHELTALDDSRPPPVATVPRDNLASGRVLAVPDGDTVLLGTPDGALAVRLIGIDAPELGAVGGGTARETLRGLLPQDSRVSFAHDDRREDEFHRDLLYLFNPDGELVNQLMVQRGAVVAHPDPPSEKGARNVRYAEQLEAAESWARQHALGLWATCPP
jgi:endonuclease YncB( thermonuclease family)